MAQSDGHSIERQRTSCLAFARDMGWVVEEELIDSGVSAYSGDHLLTGKLGDFTRKALAGAYGSGVVLVIERLDRASRETMWTAIRWLQSIVSAGVSVAFVDGGRVYEANKELDLVETIEMLVKSALSNDESAKKSQRLRAVYAAKRAKLASGHIMTKATPPWIRVEEIDAKKNFVTIPERVEVLRRIFQMSDDGFGRDVIASRLNSEGVTPWCREKAGADGWYRTFVRGLLTNAAAIGEFQPHTTVKAGGRKRRTPIGEPVQNYFPAVISADQFARVNNPETIKARQYMGIRKEMIGNLLSHISRCHSCGASMALLSKTKAGTTITKRKANGGTRTYVRGGDESYMVCERSRRSQCEHNTRYRYEYVLKSVLDEVLHLSMDDSIFARVEETAALTTRIAEITRQHEKAKSRAGNLLDIISDTIGTNGNASARAAWLTTEDDAAKLADQLAAARTALNDARGNVSPEQHIVRVNEVRAMIDHPDADTRYKARVKVLAALRGTVREIAFNLYGESWSLTMRGDSMHFSFERDGTTLFGTKRGGDGTELATVSDIRRRAAA